MRLLRLLEVEYQVLDSHLGLVLAVRECTPLCANPSQGLKDLAIDF